MLILTLTGVGIALRPDRYVEFVALGSAIVLPLWVSVSAIVALALYHRRGRPDRFDETLYLQAVASELRAGQSMRQAIISAAKRVPALDLTVAVRVASAGRPMGEVADALIDPLTDSGELTAAALRIGGESGGRAAAAFSTLAGIQTDRIELSREVTAETASIRASVVVVGGLPMLGLGYAGVTGRLADLLAFGSVGGFVIAIGVSLLLAGAGSIYVLHRSIT